VQKNAKMLAGMSSDIKALMTTVNQSQSRLHTPQQVKPQPPVSATPPEPGTPVAVIPATGTATQTQPVPPTKATVSKSGNNPYLPSSATRQGKKQFTRKQASSFFEENAKVDGMISLESGAQYRIIKPGSGKSPSASDKVVVSYVGTRLDGSVIDETYTEADPATYSMGEVMPVWRDVLQKMEEGAEFELYVPAEHTTRRSVRKRGISGFQPHIYLIELIEVVKDDEADQTQPVN
jgi:FKBP-type peptidyl-prolyl cis-trans isomerase